MGRAEIAPNFQGLRIFMLNLKFKDKKRFDKKPGRMRIARVFQCMKRSESLKPKI
jgi:hypothetical protein